MTLQPLHIVVMAATIAAQVVLAILLGFGGAMALGIGDGWELAFMPVANAVGIVVAGLAMATLARRPRPGLRDFMAALAGALLGALLLFMLPPMGFRGMLLPIFLGVITYHLQAHVISREKIIAEEV